MHSLFLIEVAARHDDGNWITIDGTHVHIGDDGNIDKGPAHLVGTKPSDHSGSSQKPAKKPPHGDNGSSSGSKWEPADGEKMLTLYHGTPARFADSIKEKGLQPGSVAHPGTGASQTRVQFTGSKEEAEHYALAFGQGKGVVVTAHIPESRVEAHPIYEGSYIVKEHGVTVPAGNIHSIEKVGKKKS